ncbi:hypothetical protein [Psychrobacillus sp. OK032]|uniref:hypothetical protein n=1 Tax=Psychrobacillus sp. OK032 TaxID=1884358 RepID=UPI0008BF402F|nr:hypothetical protein [Psychrobacillus sp. OK032]SES44107.1 hypothetical protein SAMN05518872_11336 [Psychrobacillus sp. OK032]
MSGFLKLTMGLFLAFTLTGCIGEEYDFTPPSVTISTVIESENVQSIELEEVNIDWNSDKYYKKETEDILSFAREQKPVHFKSGQKVDYDFDSQDFAIEELNVSVWNNNKEIELEINDDRSFHFPTEEGEFVIVFDLHSDKGMAQFVGNILMVGSPQEQTFESFFHEKMYEMHMGEVEYSYEPVQKEFNVVHADDAIVVFRENSDGEEKILIAYLEIVDNQWQWIQTRGAEWNSPVNWSSMNQPPYIYSGAISDKSISEVYVGNEPSKIISVEGEKRFWYAISPTKDVEITIIKDDGSKEIMGEINHEK